MTITRDHFRPAVADTTPLGRRGQVMAAPAYQEQPHRVRPVTYSTPDGPTFLGTQPTAPFGEDPTDPTTQPQPRVQTTGMVGRLNEPAPLPRGGAG